MLCQLTEDNFDKVVKGFATCQANRIRGHEMIYKHITSVLLLLSWEMAKKELVSLYAKGVQSPNDCKFESDALALPEEK